MRSNEKKEREAKKEFALLAETTEKNYTQCMGKTLMMMMMTMIFNENNEKNSRSHTQSS